MFLTVLIVAVGVDGLAIALAGDIELFAEADIPQVTCPAAGGLYLQKKTIIFRVVKAVPAHPEVGEELTLIEIEKGGFINLCLYRIESKLA